MREYHDYSLKAHNTFGIDVCCKHFVEYDNIHELRDILARLQSEGRKELLHIGQGSNLLFTGDYNGTILHSAIRDWEVVKENNRSVWVRVGAGIVWDDFVATCVDKGWYGIENLSLVPGEVGASAVQNIGAYGVEVEEYIQCVEAVNVATQESRIFTHDECEYGYRKSIFKTSLKGQYIITYVILQLSKEFVPNYKYAGLVREVEARGIKESATAKDLRQIIIEIRENKLPDPKKMGNAGSFFMNPILSADAFQRFQALHPDAPHYVSEEGVKVPAGWLIEQSGWKGKSLGNAAVHDKQALVLVNRGYATGSDIIALCEAVQRSVKERFGIELHPEVNFIGSVKSSE